MATIDNGSWRVIGDSYVGVRSTVDRLPPNVYKIVADEHDLQFVPLKQAYDHIYKLPGLPLDYIVGQVTDFWANADKYAKYQFTHKRGILLYGPPGNGKTCVISALIADLIKNDGVVICVNEFSEASAALRMVKEIEPRRKVMTLMEDMDTLLSGDYKSQEPHALSMLDGQTQVDGVLHVATTNYPHLLADRFIRRPGRFDLVIGMGMPVKITRRAYFQKILKDDNHPELDYLVDTTEGLSLAYLREIASSYLCLGIPAESSVARLRKNFTNPIKIDDGHNVGFKLGYEETNKKHAESGQPEAKATPDILSRFYSALSKKVG